MEEYYDTNREDGAEPMDIEGIDRPIGDTSHRGGPTDGIMESGMSVCTDGQEGDGGGGGDANIDHDQRHRSSGRVVKPRIVYLAEIEASQQGRGSDDRKAKKGQDQAVFGIQVVDDVSLFHFFFTIFDNLTFIFFIFVTIGIQYLPSHLLTLDSFLFEYCM